MNKRRLAMRKQRGKTSAVQGSMPADYKLWPALGFVELGLGSDDSDARGPSLEYKAMQIDDDWLRDMGKRVQTGRPLGPVQHTIGEALLRFAELPKAIEAFNRFTQAAPAHVRGFNIAVHYVAQFELLGSGKSSDARKCVARSWDIKESAVKNCCRGRICAAGKAVDKIVFLVSKRTSKADSRTNILHKLIDDMKHRANLGILKRRGRSK